MAKEDNNLGRAAGLTEEARQLGFVNCPGTRPKTALREVANIAKAAIGKYIKSER